MNDVKRLPVQHRDKPHCPTCGEEFPAFEDFVMVVPPDPEPWKVLGISIIFRMLCKCGSEWLLRKESK